MKNSLLPENLDIYQSTLEQCLKQETNLLQTIYHNICTGEQYVVPNGTFDIIIGTLIILFILAFITMVILIGRELLES